MTKVKICGLKRKEDIEFANILLPEYDEDQVVRAGQFAGAVEGLFHLRQHLAAETVPGRGFGQFRGSQMKRSESLALSTID